MSRYTILDCDQRSPEWRLARSGRLTGSAAAALLAKGKGSDEAVARRDLRVQLAVERLTGIPAEEGYTNDAMRHGIEQEAPALAAYEAYSGNLVRRTGFLSHQDLMAGASLDGDIDDCRGVLEIKAPKMATHLSYLRSPDRLSAAYNAQVHHALWITGAEWVDVASFDPRYPPELQLLVVRVERDEKAVKAYELLAVQFLREVDAELEEIRGLMAGRMAAA